MTKITLRLHTQMPFAIAGNFFRAEFERKAELGPTEVLLTTEIPVTHIELSKEVIVDCLAVPGDPYAWNIRCIPEPGGLYPNFEGKLSSHADDGDGAMILDLEVNYTPPLDALGKAFDDVFGRKVAIDTFKDFLASVAAEIRLRYAFEDVRQFFSETRLSELTD